MNASQVGGFEEGDYSCGQIYFVTLFFFSFLSIFSLFFLLLSNSRSKEACIPQENGI